MKLIYKISKAFIAIAAFVCLNQAMAQEFQGKAHYSSKTTMDMSRFGGGQMSEQQKKAMEARLKNWLEKTYILTFNKEASIYKEDEKLDAPVGGRGASMWGSSFSAGPQYKNIKSKIFIQDQEFFGKQFLIKEEMQPLEWKMTSESKQIGQYMAYKAVAMRPESEVNFSMRRRGRGNERNNEKKLSDSTKIKSADNDTIENNDVEKMIEIVAWFTPQIPIGQGPGDYWGLPGLILEVNAGNTTMLCSKIIMNPDLAEEIEAPKKGEVVTKKEYRDIITQKMEEMRNNRGRGNGRSRF